MGLSGDKELEGIKYDMIVLNRRTSYNWSHETKIRNETVTAITRF